MPELATKSVFIQAPRDLQAENGSFSLNNACCCKLQEGKNLPYLGIYLHKELATRS
jgi:hypothetical protein